MKYKKMFVNEKIHKINDFKTKCGRRVAVAYGLNDIVKKDPSIYYCKMCFKVDKK